MRKKLLYNQEEEKEAFISTDEEMKKEKNFDGDEERKEGSLYSRGRNRCLFTSLQEKRTFPLTRKDVREKKKTI